MKEKLREEKFDEFDGEMLDYILFKKCVSIEEISEWSEKTPEEILNRIKKFINIGFFSWNNLYIKKHLITRKRKKVVKRKEFRESGLK